MTDAARKALARGQALLDVGRTADAAAAFREAVAADPEEPEAHCRLALALLGEEQFEAAHEQAGAAASLDPGDEWPHRIRALALMRLKRPKEAVAAAEEAVRLEPELAVAHGVLSDTRLAAKDRRGAREAAQRAAELDPESSHAHLSLGEVAFEEGRYPEAERHYRAALELRPEHASAINDLGVVVLRQGRRDEAAELFERAGRLDPSLDEARANLGTSARRRLNGVFILVGSLVGIRGLALLVAADSTPGERAAGAALLVAIAAAFVIRRQKVMSELSPAERRLLADQRWWQRIELTSWRPIFWLIPSPVWFAGCLVGLILVGVDVAGRGAVRSADLTWLVVLLAGSVVFGYYGRRWMRARGWA
jgi:tetratricopeptide (TPR) repeat protein